MKKLIKTLAVLFTAAVIFTGCQNGVKSPVVSANPQKITSEKQWGGPEINVAGQKALVISFEAIPADDAWQFVFTDATGPSYPQMSATVDATSKKAVIDVAGKGLSKVTIQHKVADKGEVKIAKIVTVDMKDYETAVKLEKGWGHDVE